MPIVIRRDLAAFSIYSRTDDGDPLDPLQLALLRRSADAAAMAYERIEIAEQRDAIERLRREVAHLRAGLTLADTIG